MENQNNEINQAIRALARLILPDDEFNSLLEELARETRSILENELREEYIPTAFIALRQESGKMALAICPIMTIFPDSSEGKDMLFESLGKAIEEKNIGEPVAFFTATEAWMAAVEKDDKLEIPVLCKANREEVICISGTTVDGRTNMCSMPIERNGDNMILLREANIMPYKDNENNFYSAFAERFFYGYATAQVKDFVKTNPDIPVHAGGTDQLLQSWDNPTA